MKSTDSGQRPKPRVHEIGGSPFRTGAQEVYEAKRHLAKSAGETKLSNLITLCSFHHGLVHEGGYGLHVTDDGLFVFTRPDGRRVESNGSSCFRGNSLPPITSNYRGFEESLRDYLSKHGQKLSITAETASCKWGGERMDYSMAIESMQFLEQKAAEASQQNCVSPCRTAA